MHVTQWFSNHYQAAFNKARLLSEKIDSLILATKQYIAERRNSEKKGGIKEVVVVDKNLFYKKRMYWEVLLVHW